MSNPIHREPVYNLKHWLDQYKTSHRGKQVLHSKRDPLCNFRFKQEIRKQHSELPKADLEALVTQKSLEARAQVTYDETLEIVHSMRGCEYWFWCGTEELLSLGERDRRLLQCNISFSEEDAEELASWERRRTLDKLDTLLAKTHYECLRNAKVRQLYLEAGYTSDEVAGVYDNDSDDEENRRDIAKLEGCEEAGNVEISVVAAKKAWYTMESDLKQRHREEVQANHKHILDMRVQRRVDREAQLTKDLEEERNHFQVTLIDSSTGDTMSEVFHKPFLFAELVKSVHKWKGETLVLEQEIPDNLVTTATGTDDDLIVSHPDKSLFYWRSSMRDIQVYDDEGVQKAIREDQEHNNITTYIFWIAPGTRANLFV